MRFTAQSIDKFIHIRSSKFPVLPGEKEELVSDGMYGKALALYLQLRLHDRGYDTPFVCCEDWGWWVELKDAPFAFGVCIYAGPGETGPKEFVCTDGSIERKKWSWKQLQFVQTAPWVEQLYEDLMAIFQADEEVEIVEVTEEFPDLEASTVHGLRTSGEQET